MDNPDDRTVDGADETPAAPAMVRTDSAPVPDPAIAATARPAITSPLPPDIEAAVEAWFARHFHNLGAELSVALYNRLYTAKAELLALFHTS